MTRPAHPPLDPTCSHRSRGRTSFKRDGQIVDSAPEIARRYIHTWFFPDLFSVLFPVASHISDSHSWFNFFYLLRVQQVAKLVKKLTGLGQGAIYVRIVTVVFVFVLIAHWLGLLWYISFEEEITSPTSPRYPDVVDVTGVTSAERYACCLYWAFGVMTQLLDQRECVRDMANDRFSNELGQVGFMLAVFLIGLIATSTIFGVLAELVANIGQETARYRKQIDVLNELFKSQKLPQKLYQKVRDYVEAEFAQTKGVDVASACSDLPPRLQIEIFFHLNRKLVMHVPLFTRLPSDWIDAMVMQMQFSFFVSGTVVIEEETVSDCCYFVKRGILQSIHDDMVMRTFTENGFFGDVRALFSGPSLVQVRAVTDSMLLTLTSEAVELVNAAFPEVRSIFKHIRKMRQRLYRKNPMAASGLESVEEILRGQEEKQQTATAVRRGSLLSMSRSKGSSQNLGSQRRQRSVSRELEDKHKLTRMSTLLNMKQNKGGSQYGSAASSHPSSNSQNGTSRGSSHPASQRAHDSKVSWQHAPGNGASNGGSNGANFLSKVDDDQGATTPAYLLPETDFSGTLQSNLDRIGSFNDGILDGSFRDETPGTTPANIRSMLPRSSARVAPEPQADSPWLLANNSGADGFVFTPSGTQAGSTGEFTGLAALDSSVPAEETTPSSLRADARTPARQRGSEQGDGGVPTPPPSPPGGPDHHAHIQGPEQKNLTQLLLDLNTEVRILRDEVHMQKAAMYSIGRDVKKALASQSAAGVDSTMIRLFPFSFHDDLHDPRKADSSSGSARSFDDKQTKRSGMTLTLEVLGAWSDIAQGAGKPSKRRYSDDELQKVFDEINSDKSGEIDRRQLKKALKQINPHADDALAEAMLTIADADGDVRVSVDEFIRLIRGDPLKQREARRRLRASRSFRRCQPANDAGAGVLPDDQPA